MIEKIFTEIDDFCLHFEPEFNQFLIKLGCKKRNKKETLSISEVATIVVMFHRSGYRYFKDFYIKNVQKNWKKYFPVLVSYNRFVELMPKALFALCSFLKTRFGKPTGISYIDSTSLAVCENSRAKRHKVFKDEAGWGKSSTGWYFGFKLHLIVSDTGELLGAKCTSGNTDDRSVLEEMCSELIGKLFGDRGYISKDKAEMLYEKYGVELITTTKKNMKKKPISLLNKILLRGRSIIETINDQLKNIQQVEHSRHRSKINFMVNLVSGLVAYTYQEKKPSLGILHTGLVPLGV